MKPLRNFWDDVPEDCPAQFGHGKALRSRTVLRKPFEKWKADTDFANFNMRGPGGGRNAHSESFWLFVTEGPAAP